MAAVIVAREVHHRARDNFVDTIYSSLCESITRTEDSGEAEFAGKFK